MELRWLVGYHIVKITNTGGKYEKIFVIDFEHYANFEGLVACSQDIAQSASVKDWAVGKYYYIEDGQKGDLLFQLTKTGVKIDDGDSIDFGKKRTMTEENAIITIMVVVKSCTDNKIELKLTETYSSQSTNATQTMIYTIEYKSNKKYYATQTVDGQTSPEEEIIKEND